MIKEYYALTKSGLVFGNLITVIGGFALAARGVFNFWTLLATLVGMSLIMASGCVFNNYIDRDIDGAMGRTKGRALVTGRISGRAALVFATCLGVAGFLALALWTNFLALAMAGVGFLFYVVMYSMWWKRRSTWGTFVGSISGAMPPVVGYCAAGGRLDLGAALLFAILVVWQMSHFFAIAIRRADEYAAAHVPVLPVARGVPATKRAMLLYVVAFTLIAPLLTVFGYTGDTYFAIASVLGVVWLILSIKGFFVSGAAADIRWARTTFFFSLVVMVMLFATITAGELVR